MYFNLITFFIIFLHTRLNVYREIHEKHVYEGGRGENEKKRGMKK